MTQCVDQKYKYYLFDLGYEIKRSALGARQEKANANENSEDRQFQSGRLMAYYEVVSLMQQQAAGFDIPLTDIRLDDIEPDRDLIR